MAAQVALRRQQEQEEELGISVPEVVTTEQQQAAQKNSSLAGRGSQSEPGSLVTTPTTRGPSPLFDVASNSRMMSPGSRSVPQSPSMHHHHSSLPSTPTLAQQLTAGPSTSGLGRMSLARSSPDDFDDDASCK